MRDGLEVPLPKSAQRLIAFVALRQRPVTRSQAAERLWPDVSDGRAQGRLRSALWRLHCAAGPVVQARGHNLVLAPDVAVDVRDVTTIAESVLAGTCALDADQIGLLCRSEDLLPGWCDEWADTESECFRQLRLHALERSCEQLCAQGRFPEALTAGLAAVRGDPLRESAHRALIGMHLAEGNCGEAIRQLEHYQRLLSDRPGLRPSVLLGRFGASLGPTGGTTDEPQRTRHDHGASVLPRP